MTAQPARDPFAGRVTPQAMGAPASASAFQRIVADDLSELLEVLPPHICEPLRDMDRRHELLEVVLDLGREPEARFPGDELILSDRPVVQEDLEYVVSRIGAFGGDNR